jgi:hypothetical protein
MTTRTRIVGVGLGVGAFVLLMASASAVPLPTTFVAPCLDVGIPPGLPFEWATPSRVPTESLRMHVRKKEGDPKATRVRRPMEVSSRPRLYTEKTTAMAFARVTTVDILTHFNWNEGPQTDLVSRPTKGRVATGGTLGPEVSVAYPPDIPLDLYWVSFATWLRENLHPNQVSDAESIERLVEIGFPAMCVLHDVATRPVAKQQSFYVQNPQVAKARLARWQKILRDRVGPLPQTKPRSVADPKDPERSMLLRMVADDLADGYASSVDDTFAGRLLSLPAQESLPLLVAYARPSTHPLLLRNAVALLGSYPEASALAALSLVASKSSDDVARVRAFMALARMGSQEARAAAVARVRAVSPLTGVHVLGVLRAPEGVKHAMKLLRRGGVEDKLVAIRALGRIGIADKKVVRALNKAFSSFAKAKPGSLYEKPAWKADVPDSPSVRRDTLGQLCLIALARLGDKPAKKKVLALLARKPQAPGKNQAPFFNRDAVASLGTFGAFTLPTLAFLVESLEFLGDDAVPHLRRVVEDKVCDTGLRLAGWRALDRLHADTKDLVEKLAKAGSKPGVRVAALRRWSDLDSAKALERATEILKNFTTYRAGGQLEVMEAARIIGSAGKGAKLSRSAMVKLKGATLRDRPARLAKVLVSIPIARLTVKGEAQEGWIQASYTSRGKTIEGWVEVRFLRIDQAAADQLLAKTLGNAKRPKKNKSGVVPGGGGAKPRLNNNPTIEVHYPVAEALAAALAGFNTKASRAALIAYLKDNTQPASARGAVCAALASFKSSDSKQALAASLSDEDGWVRYCAFRALRHMGADVPFCDWIFAEEEVRAEATKALEAWAAK